MRGYKTEGIVLKRINFGETDRILTIYTKHYGKVKAIAKGIRRLKSRKAASLELFNQLRLVMIEGRNFDLIIETETINNFPRIRKNLKLIVQAFQMAEALDKLTPEGEPNQRLFALLLASLAGLDRGQEGIVLEFEIQLLRDLGFGLPKKLDLHSVRRYIESISERKLISQEIK